MTELSLLSLQQETLNAFANSRFFLEHNYLSEHNMWDRNAKLDYEFAKLTSENQAMLCSASLPDKQRQIRQTLFHRMPCHPV